MKYFGTDGIRAKAETFTPDFIGCVIKGLVDYAGDNIKVLIGGDTRESTEWILAELETALETFGIEYGNVGVLPTPAINYCFFEMGFDFAIDVTASHNPYTDNGIKIFERSNKYGVKLCREGCEKIEAAIRAGKTYDMIAPSLRESLHDDAVSLYTKHLLDYIGDADFKGLKIGMDCANGATSVIAADIFRRLGAQVELINCEECFTQNINKKCGSTYLKPLQKLVAEKNLNFGVAFDGDGDRVLMVNEIKEEVDGDELLAILAESLDIPSVVITVMANQGLLIWLQEKQKRMEITAVGDSNVLAAMQKNHIRLGGEQSGHIILPGEPTGDGILTALMVTKIVAEKKKTLGELASVVTKYPQIIINMPADANQKERLKDEAAKKILDEFDDKVKKVFGRILVRPSGTEELIRIAVWGDDQKAIKVLANNLRKELEKVL